MRTTSLSAAGKAVLAGLVLANLAVEGALSGADLGLWGAPWWRQVAFDLAGFRRWLLLGEPGEYPRQPALMFVSHAFLHAGSVHLAGNMLALLALSPNLLRRLGIISYLALYLASACAGAAAFVLLSQTSAPMVGASGAIFGLMGAWARFSALGHARWARLGALSAQLIGLNLALWFLTGGMVAWQAHLGGFLAGFALAFRLRERPLRNSPPGT